MLNLANASCALKCVISLEDVNLLSLQQKQKPQVPKLLRMSVYTYRPMNDLFVQFLTLCDLLFIYKYEPKN